MGDNRDDGARGEGALEGRMGGSGEGVCQLRACVRAVSLPDCRVEPRAGGMLLESSWALRPTTWILEEGGW